MAVTPQQLSQQYKTELQSQGYVVGSDGTVRKNGAAVPPWSWAQSVPELRDATVTVQGQQVSPYTLTPGYNESAWHDMNVTNGPFSNPPAWDPQTGTYSSSTDWGTLLGTAGVGGLFAAPAIAGALAGGGGTAAAAGAGSSAGSGAAAGTGATVATAAPSAAGWFSPSSLIPSIVGGIASIYGANQQANANQEGAQLQYQSTEEALKDARDQRAYQQQQYADYLGRLSPYLSLGTNAGSTLQNLLAKNPYSQYANAPTSAPQPQSPQPMTQAPSSSPAMNTSSGQSMVTLRAPDGSQKQVNAADAQHYLGLGATAV